MQVYVHKCTYTWVLCLRTCVWWNDCLEEKGVLLYWRCLAEKRHGGEWNRLNARGTGRRREEERRRGDTRVAVAVRWLGKRV